MSFRSRIVPLCFFVLCIALMGAAALAQDRYRKRPDHAPRAGEKAPDFQLELVSPTAMARTQKSTKNSKKPATWKLSNQRNKKPVVLAFGSYT